MKALFFIALFALIFFSYGQKLKGLMLVANYGNDTVSFYNPQTKQFITSIETGRKPKDIALSIDHKHAAVSNLGENTVSILDCISKRMIKKLRLEECNQPYGLRFLDQQHLLVSCKQEQFVIIMDWSSGRIIRRIRTSPISPELLIVNRDKSSAFITDMEKGQVSAIDLTKKTAKNFYSGSGAHGLALTFDEKDLWIANKFENTISIVDVQDLKVKDKLRTGMEPTHVKFAMEKYVLVTCAKDNQLCIYDYKQKSKIKSINFEKTESLPKALWVYENYALVSLFNANEVALVDLNNFKVVDYYRGFKNPTTVVFCKPY